MYSNAVQNPGFLTDSRDKRQHYCYTPFPLKYQLIPPPLTEIPPLTDYLYFNSYDDFPGWQFFDASEHGFCLDVPPFTAFTLSSSSSRIMCSLVSDDFCIPPDGADESLVSYIVDFDLSFPGRDRKGPVIITLAHSGADRSLGYETVVKSFDKYQRIYNWREIKGTSLFVIGLG